MHTFFCSSILQFCQSSKYYCLLLICNSEPADSFQCNNSVLHMMTIMLMLTLTLMLMPKQYDMDGQRQVDVETNTIDDDGDRTLCSSS